MKVSDYFFDKWELILYPLLMVVVGLLLSSNFGVWTALLFFGLFIVIGILKERKFLLISVFYALYALLMNSFLGYIVAQPYEYLFSFFKFMPQSFVFLAIAVTPAIINFLILSGMERWLPQYSLKSLRQVGGLAMGMLILILISVTALLYLVLSIENRSQASNWLNNLIIMGLFIVVVFSLLVLNVLYQRRRKQEIQSLKDTQMAQLQEYTQHIEALYDEMNRFKHDYINILTSLDEGIKAQDIREIKNIYEAVIQPTKQSFQTNRFMIARLSNIQVSEIKSLLSAKLLIAKQNKIDIQVETVKPITQFNMDLLGLIRIISILLDNAIEAAVLTENPWIHFAIFEEENLQVMIIENSSPERVNIKKASDKGYSSKGLNRGIGLYTVNQILNETPNAWLETISETNKFIQRLKILEE